MNYQQLKQKYKGDISKITEEEWIYLSKEDLNSYEYDMLEVSNK